MEFKNSKANLVVANLTSPVVHILSSTIMATIENFDENDFDSLEWSDCTNLRDSVKSRLKSI